MSKVRDIIGGVSDAASQGKRALDGAIEGDNSFIADDASRAVKNGARAIGRKAGNAASKALAGVGKKALQATKGLLKKVLIPLIPILLIVFAIIMVIIFFLGGAAFFSYQLSDAFRSGRAKELIPEIDGMSEAQFNVWMDDPRNMYRLIEASGAHGDEVDLSANGMAMLDYDTMLRLFKAIKEYEDEREKEKEVTYKWRREISPVVVHDEETGEDIEYLYEFPPIPDDVNTTTATIEEDYTKEHPMNVTYDDLTHTTVAAKNVESYVLGSNDAFAVRWQPIYALACIAAREKYEGWNPNGITFSDGLKNADMKNYYLSDDEIDQIIKVFLFERDYYYDAVNDGPDEYEFTDFNEDEAAYFLHVQGTASGTHGHRITMRMPASAPRKIYNKFIEFRYNYEFFKDEAVLSDDEEAEEGVPETASNGSNVTIIGDSITAYSRAEIQALLPEAKIDAQGGRTVHLRSPQQQGGLETAEKLKAAGELRDIVVFAMGTNNAGPNVNNMPFLSEAMLDQLKSIVEDRRVFLVTNYDSYDGYGRWWETNNTVIRSYCSRYDNWSYIDWAGNAVNSYLEWEPEGVHKGVHPNQQGKEWFAKLLYDAVEPYLNDEIEHGGEEGTLRKDVSFMVCKSRKYTINPTAFRIACNECIVSDQEFDLDEFLLILEELPSTAQDRIFYGNDTFRTLYDLGYGEIEEYTEDPVVCKSIGVHYHPEVSEVYVDPDTGEVSYVPQPTTVVNMGDNARYAYERMKEAGWPDALIFAIMGNLGGEGFNTAMRGDKDSVGIAQWRLDRRTALYAYAARTGLRVDSIECQMGYLIEEDFPRRMREQGHYNDAMSATNIRVATDIVCIYFESPAVYSSQSAWLAAGATYGPWSRYSYSDVDGKFHIDLDKRRNYAYGFAQQFGGG